MIGEKLGGYEVVAKLGEGGMGVVYRARDLKLGRDVAIKVLPPQLAGDASRLLRLRREAQLLASLNHPHIATVHGLEETNGACAVVMELVEGDDLRQRLARGPLSQEEALAAARQIAAALEAAHAQGIVHRDLKPANVKLRADGSVKVLDFGLAKAVEAEPVPSTFAESPTVTSPAQMTEAGVLLGTAAYMSPEQAKGQPADKRADIWAFGCVLYEMLTARPIFPGATITETLAAILEREPDWTALPAQTAAPARRLLRRCLEKDPRRRLHDIADARIEIDDGLQGEKDAAPGAHPPRSGALPWVVATIGIGVAAAAGWFLRPVPSPAELRVDVATSPTPDSSFAISPDGTQVVFVARAAAGSQLWLRPLTGSVARPLPGTERGTLPFWSPNSRTIAFFADAKLKRIDIDGGSVHTLANAGVPYGGTWGAEDTILFAENPGGGIRRLNAQGGQSSEITHVDPDRQRGHHLPQFIPGTSRYMQRVTGTPEAKGIYVGDLNGSPPRRLFDADDSAVYLNAGYVMYARGGTLYAQRFDANRAEVTGDPVILEEGAAGRLWLAASAAGPFGYRESPSQRGQHQLLWVDRAGKQLEQVTYQGNAAFGPALSRDGRHVAVFRFLNGNMDLWSYDRVRRVWDKLTEDSGDDIFPLWSSDGRTLFYAGVRKGALLNVFKRAVSAPPQSEQPLLATPGGEFPMDVSADGRYLLFSRLDPKRGVDIWAVSLTDAKAAPFEVVATEASETIPQFSPDGKWIAYQSDRTGRDEIYVRPFPGPGAVVTVSSEGGNQVRWIGSELFYIAADDRMMAVAVTVRPNGTDVDLGTPTPLFQTRISSTVRLRYRQQYVVTPDGKSFGLNMVLDEGSSPPIRLVFNWKPGR